MDFRIELPHWVHELLARIPACFPTREDRVRFAISLAHENVQRGTGGPFGAAIFDADGRLVAPGLNLVVKHNCSIFHAEMVAIALAQKRLGRYDISDGGRSEHELAVSAEPCAMCLGAIPWSGVARLACGAREADARAIGFDEGAKPPNWQQALEERGVQVVRDVLRQEAVGVLDLYAKGNGTVYNPRLPK